MNKNTLLETDTLLGTRFNTKPGDNAIIDDLSINPPASDDPISVAPRDKQHWLEMRSHNLNSTDIPALFGASPYLTEFELWHRMRTPSVNTIAPNERMDWGNALEEAIAKEIGRKQGWTVEPMKDYTYLPISKLGSSFDFYIVPPKEAPFYHRFLEIKNVDSLAFAKNWIEHDEDDIEAPLHIELQVQHQMLVSGIHECYIGALVGGNTLKLINRRANLEIHAAIEEKAAAFWQSVKDNRPPQINYQTDSKFVISLYNHAEPNKLLDAKDDAILEALVHGYNVTGGAIKELESDKEAFKAQILEHIKDSEKVTHPSWTISAGITPECEVAFTRKSFRNFRVTQKKSKTSSATTTTHTNGVTNV